MNDSFLENLFSLFGFIVVFVCQCLAIIFLGKTRMDLAWWIMLAGTILAIVGEVATMVVPAYISTIDQPIHDLLVWHQIAAALHIFGILLFTAGFLVHGISSFNYSRRIKQLEDIIATQAEELNQRRSSQP